MSDLITLLSRGQLVSLINFDFDRMSKTYLAIILFLALVSCTAGNERQIVLFNDITFKLNEGETIIAIDEKEKKAFHSFFDSTPIQVPLFRCIKGDNYTIYLAIPINTSIIQLADYKLANTSNLSFYDSDSSSYFYINHQHEAKFVTEYSEVINENYIYVLAASSAPQLSDTLFNKKMLAKRLSQ